MENNLHHGDSSPPSLHRSNLDSEKSELSSHKDKFDEFFRQRQKKKRKEYVRIAKIGFVAAIIGVLIALLSFVLKFTIQGMAVAANILQAIGGIGLTLGILILSVVPVEHINIEHILDKVEHPGRRALIVYSVGIIGLIFNILISVQPPFVVSMIMGSVTFLILDDRNDVFLPLFTYLGLPEQYMPPDKFSLKLSLYLLMAPLAYSASSIFIGVDANAYMEYCLIEDSCADDFINDIIKPHYEWYRIVYFVIAVLLFSLSLGGLRSYISKGRSHRYSVDKNLPIQPGCDETTRLLDAIYIIIMSTAVIYIMFGINWWHYTDNMFFFVQVSILSLSLFIALSQTYTN